MRENFSKALALVLAHEGGFVNHPADPGGATNRGVTQAVYDGWRGARGLSKQSVRHITNAEIEAIYRRDYWDKIRGDDLPGGVDYAVFDFAVNSGVARAIKYLQTAVGVGADGIIGPKTLAMVQHHERARLIESICTARLNFLKGLGTFKTFGRGWTRRVEEVQAKACGMVTL